MTRIAKLLLLLTLSCPLSLLAQYTQVSATVTDPNGFAYANCRGSVAWTDQNTTPGHQSLLYGSVFQTQVPISGCDSFGHFSIKIADNNQVQPTPSQWNFSICDSTGTTCFTKLITITGTTQDVSATLSAAAPIISAYLGTGNAATLQGKTWASPAAIGTTTPNTGSFTTLQTVGITDTGSVTFTKLNGTPFASRYASLSLALAASGSGAVEIDAPMIASSQVALAAGQVIKCRSGLASINNTASTPLFKFDGITEARVEGCTISVNSNSSTAGCFDFENDLGPTTSNYVTNNKCWQTLTPGAPVTGQYALQMNATNTNALYWNHINDNDFNNWDRSIRLQGNGALNVVNDNWFNNTGTHAANRHIEIVAFANENHFYGVSCSTSGGPASNTCITLGDGVNGVINNGFREVVGDQGASGQTFQIKANANYNNIDYIESNGVASTDAGTGNMSRSVSALGAGIQVPTLQVRATAAQSTNFPSICNNSVLFGSSSNTLHFSIWGDTIGNKQVGELWANQYTCDGTTYTVPQAAYGSVGIALRGSSTDSGSLIQFLYRTAGSGAGTQTQVGSVSNTGKGTFNGGVHVGTSGTDIAQILNCSGAITPASVGATTCAEQTFTIGACSGLATTDTIIVNQSAASTTLAMPVGDWRVSSAGVIARTYCNPTAGALTPTAQTLKIWALH